MRTSRKISDAEHRAGTVPGGVIVTADRGEIAVARAQQADARCGGADLAVEANEA